MVRPLQKYVTLARKSHVTSVVELNAISGKQKKIDKALKKDANFGKMGGVMNLPVNMGLSSLHGDRLCRNWQKNIIKLQNLLKQIF